MKRSFIWLTAIALFAGVCWVFPLFRVVPLEQAAKKKSAAVFDPTEFAEKFWNERLLKSLDKAVKTEALLPLIQKDPSAARKKFGRSVGVSESYSFFVSGKGRVVAVNDDEVLLAVTNSGTEAEISLQTGLLFGNAVRDGTELLNVSDYPNSQDFNAISEALNRIVEEHVMPGLREKAKPGGVVSFVGCAEVNDETTDVKPLKVIPIWTNIQ